MEELIRFCQQLRNIGCHDSDVREIFDSVASHFGGRTRLTPRFEVTFNKDGKHLDITVTFLYAEGTFKGDVYHEMELWIYKP